MAGLIGGWMLARALARRDVLWGGRTHPDPVSLDDLLVYMTLGIVAGGRIGYVLFYNLPFYLAHPIDMLIVWQGGMSFHGGLLGATIAIMLFSRRTGVPLFAVADLVAVVVPIGLLFGRIANFIKPELWGRVSDAPWAMVFPGAGPLSRHPSQLYEAALEGVVLFAILMLAVRAGGLRRPGLLTGLFLVGYGMARIAAEFFREPDPQLGFLFAGATMGMILSVPLIAAGVPLIVGATRRREVLA